MRRIILTGAPGAGKTTLLAALRARGFAAVDDSARALIRERIARNLPPRPPALEFAREVLRREIASYRLAPDGGLVFCDRSVIEALYMLDEAGGLQPHELRDHLARYPYYRRVFILPPWEAIYARDAERDQSFSEALRVHQVIVRCYQEFGYELLEVPPDSVVARCDHILQALTRSDT